MNNFKKKLFFYKEKLHYILESLKEVKIDKNGGVFNAVSTQHNKKLC